MKQPLASIVMAVRNELGNIEPTIKGINELDGNFELIFVEGHSKDGTFEEIKKLAGKNWRYPIRFAVQDGIGKKDALLKGFDMANGDILLMYDLDGEIPPSQIGKFYEALGKDENLLAIGNRFVKGRTRKIHPLNWIGNLFFALLVSILTGQRVRDALLGIKGFWRRHYSAMKSAGVFENDYDRFAEFDLLFGASRLGLKIKTIPTAYYHRRYGETKVHRFRTGWQFLKRCFSEFFYQLSLNKATPSHFLVLILIFAAALGLRLININGGFFDHASVRSAETFTIAKNFITQNLSIWRPRVDWGGPNGGFVKFEFQLYTYLLSILMQIFGLKIIIGRLLTIAISLLSGWFFYKILTKFFSPRAALFGLAVYLLNPIMIYFGRAIQPDSLMIFFGILGIWFMVKDRPQSLLAKILGAVSIMIAMLLKPTAGVFLAPFLILFFGIDSWRDLFNKVLSRKILLYILVATAIIFPVWLYYSYINRVGDFSILNARTWWISWESIKAYFTVPLYQKYLAAAGLFFNPIGWFFLFTGLFLRYGKKDFFVQPFVLSVLAFAIAMSPQWLQGFHEWHFMIAIPIMGLVGAKIFNDWKAKKLPNALPPKILLLLYFLFIPPAIYGLFFISNTKAEIIYHNVEIIKHYTPHNSVVAVTDPGSTITNFYLGRISVYFGMPINEENINWAKNRGAQFLVVTRPGNISKEEKEELKKMPLIYNNEKISIYQF